MKKMNRDELVYEKIKQAMQILDEIDKMIDSQSEELQNVDYELSDWLHFIESNEINDKDSTNIIKEIRNLRQKRRSLHNEYEIEKTYKSNSAKVMGNNTRQLLLAEINKTLKQLDSEYKNRILTEEKINELLNNKKKKGRPRKNENNN